jgi:hypothetical protein
VLTTADVIIDNKRPRALWLRGMTQQVSGTQEAATCILDSNSMFVVQMRPAC